jgi:lipopolysaccharide export system permease protein
MSFSKNMILIQRYILKELIYNFLFAFAVIALILLLAMTVSVMYKFPMLGFILLVKNIPVMLAKSQVFIIPLSMLVATVMTYGRIAADNEIVTMRASGIHALRILVPGLLLGLLTSFALLYMNDRLVPMAERRLKTLGSDEDLNYILDSAIKSGNKQMEHGPWLLTWENAEKISRGEGEEEKINPVDSWRLFGLRGKELDEEGNLKKEFVAKSAVLMVDDRGRLGVSLFQGEFTYGPSADFGKLQLPPRELFNARKYTVRLSMRSMAALQAMRGRTEKAYPEHQITTELHKRIASSFSPLVFVFLSLPLVILFKLKNRIVAFLIAILIAFFVYYPVTLLGETFANKGILHPVLSIWAGSFLLTGLGLGLIWKVMRR